MRHLSLTWVLPDILQQFILYKCTASIKQAKKTVSTFKPPINQYKEITVTALFWRWKPMKIKQPWVAGSFFRISGGLSFLICMAWRSLWFLLPKKTSQVGCEWWIVNDRNKMWKSHFDRGKSIHVLDISPGCRDFPNSQLSDSHPISSDQNKLVAVGSACGARQQCSHQGESCSSTLR